MTYVFDIDGTICTNTYGKYEKAIPLMERIKKINFLYDNGHTIIMLTARGMGRTGNNRQKSYELLYEFTKRQLDGWGLKFHELFLGKPSGDFYIDDKGVKDEDFFNDEN